MASNNKDQEPQPALDGSAEADLAHNDLEAELLDSRPTPRSITFKYLSILWLLPTVGAIWILVAQAGPILSKPSFLTKLAAVSVEQWVALVLVLLHTIFIGLARHYRQKEKISEMSGS